MRRDDCDEFLQFVDEYSFDGGIDIFERIGDAMWNDGKVDGVTITSSSSYGPEVPGGEYHGEIDIGEHTYGFHLESSNRRGDVMHSWEQYVS